MEIGIKWAVTACVTVAVLAQIRLAIAITKIEYWRRRHHSLEAPLFWAVVSIELVGLGVLWLLG